MVAHLDYPVKQFSGTKSIVISTVSWIGGKQPFLGWAYIAAAILCVVLAIAGLVRHLIKPRKLGDMSCRWSVITRLTFSAILEQVVYLIPHGYAPTWS